MSRAKGQKDSRTLQREARIKRGGIVPLDYFLEILRDEDQPPDLRFEAAKAAAPFVHPRLTASDVSHSGHIHQTHEHRAVSQADERIEELLSTGQSIPAAPPVSH